MIVVGVHGPSVSPASGRQAVANLVSRFFPLEINPFTNPDSGSTEKCGCNTTSPWRFDSTHHINISIGDRSFYVYISPSYHSSRQHPVVLSYHGYSDNETHQEKISGFSDPTIRINNLSIIAVYPAGAYGPGKFGKGPKRAWQGAPYAAPGVNDISFTHTIIQELQENLCIDPRRIFAAGKSNGGGFVNLLACSSTSSTFAAFAPVSAALYPGTQSMEGCNPGHPVPLINFHGLSDNIVPFKGRHDENGDTNYATPNIQTWREGWASRNGCRNPKTDSTVTKDVFNKTTLIAWRCVTDDPRTVVKGYNVAQLGHSWPTTLGLDGGKTSFNATTAAIIPFFESHVS
jgi:poly(3-hydroxybutyrate) depolymerase